MPAMDAPETVIVGGGIAGLATAWALAERGARGVCVLEREARVGMHSTGLNAGILRAAIDSPVTRKLARETAALLRYPPDSLSPHARGPLLDACGLVVWEGSPDLPEPRWLADALADGAAGLEPEEAVKLAPHLSAEGQRAWHFPQLGKIDRDGLALALEAAAKAAGVEVRTQTRVERVTLGKDGSVRGVKLSDGEMLSAPRVVLAPGGWAAQLGASCGARFPGRATRRHLFLTKPSPKVDPRWPVTWDDTAGFYCLPQGSRLMLCLCDEEDTDPQACHPDPMIGRRLQRRVQASLPTLADSLEIESSWCAMRTVSEDDHPVAGADPMVPGLWWVGALGGHGMSIGLALGRTAATLLAGEAIPEPLRKLLDPASPEREYTPTRRW